MPDTDVAELVRSKLAFLMVVPDEVVVEVDHGCVVLRGHVSTERRARVVRAIARVRGVDSVVDLLREPPAAGVSRPRISRSVPSRRPRGRGWRIGITLGGLGLAFLGLRARGAVGLAMAATGAAVAVLAGAR